MLDGEDAGRTVLHLVSDRTRVVLGLAHAVLTLDAAKRVNAMELWCRP